MPDARTGARLEAESGASWSAARLRRRARQGWRQFGFRRQFVAVLVVAACLAAVGTVAVAALWVPPLRPEAGALLVIGLALTALCLLAAYLLAGPISRRAYTALTGGLDEVAYSATQLEALSQAQATHSRQQALLARQLSDEVRALAVSAERLEQGVELLRGMAGDIWAGMPYPPSAVDAPINARSARRVAVTASELGAAIEQTTALCYRLRARTNLVIAEADLLGTQGRESEQQLSALREGVARVEQALGRDAALAPGARQSVSRSARLGGVDARPRAGRGLLRALGALVASWGQRESASDVRHTFGASQGRAGGAMFAGGAFTTNPNHHAAVGWTARPGASTNHGHATPHPRSTGAPPRPRENDRRAVSSGRHNQPPTLQPRRTPRLGDGDWLNGNGGPF